MITPLPSDAVRTAALRDALTDALRAGKESVLHYALLLMEHDLRLPTPIVTANEGGKNEGGKDDGGKDEGGAPEPSAPQPTGLTLQERRTEPGMVEAPTSGPTQEAGPNPGVPGSLQGAPFPNREGGEGFACSEVNLFHGDDTEAEMKARTYILARHQQGEYIDCAAICRLTGWDAAHIRRFIAATLDELHPTPTTRKRGRPRTIPTAGEKFRQ